MVCRTAGRVYFLIWLQVPLWDASSELRDQADPSGDANSSGVDLRRRSCLEPYATDLLKPVD
jgi:hypothetical protein